MLRPFTRGLLTVAALLTLLTPSSALATTAPHRASKHAARGSRTRSRRKAAAVRRAGVASSTVLLGDSSVEPQYRGLPAGQAEAFHLEDLNSGTGGVVHLYVGDADTARTALVGVYAEAAGRPGELLAAGQATIARHGAWNTISIGAVALTAGYSYWLAVMGEGGSLHYHFRLPGPCASQVSAQTTLTALPSLWRSGVSRAACPVSAYVTVSTGGTGGEPVSQPGAPIEGSIPANPLGGLEQTSETSTPPSETKTETPPSETKTETPPPAAPVEVTAPIVSGVAEEGQTLTATSGSWSGSPTSYGYQWQDCNAAGEACVSVSGATGSSYVLTSGDVGHTVRVAVTATNAGGSTVASSTASALVVAVPPPPPAAPVNSVAPAVSGSTVEGQTLSATSGSWSGSPTSYGYQWQDCNAAGEACASVSGATGSSYELTSGDVGRTVRVAVTATNAGGSAVADSSASAAVLPLAPVDSVAPAVSGTAVEGETLSATSGSWSPTPSSYAYQWEDCGSAGEGCSPISGASASTRVLAAGDVGHTLRVIVKATDAGGTGEALSTATDVVSAKEKTKATPTNCFENPETEGTARFEACGYPGPKNTGEEAATGKKCSELAKAGATTISTAGEKVEGKDFTGAVLIRASNVTLNDDCVNYDGENKGGSPALKVESSADDVTIENTSVIPKNNTTESWEEAIDDHGPEKHSGSGDSEAPTGNVLRKVRLEGCGECLTGQWKASESYLFANQDPGDLSLHRETVYANNEVVEMDDDTMFTPEMQTAIIFDNVANGLGKAPCSNRITVEGGLISGGGQMIQTCGSRATETANASLTVRNTRMARCVTTPIVEDSYGMPICSGSGPEGSDSHGYMPYGGSLSVLGEGPYGTVTWEGNYWDNNLEVAAK